jgi:hypothetical protein
MPRHLQPFVGRFGRHDGETVHFEKLHQRSPDRHVVFDDEYEARGIFVHSGLPRLYVKSAGMFTRDIPAAARILEEFA